MKTGKIQPLSIGSLVRDVDMGDIGIVVGPLVEVNLGAMGFCRTQLVLWQDHREPVDMDMSALESGWVEVISENR